MTEPQSPGISRMRCSEIMTREVKTAEPGTSLRDAAVMMRDGDMGSLPVIDGGRLVGIVTDRDMVVRVVAEGKGAETPVSEAMRISEITGLIRTDTSSSCSSGASGRRRLRDHNSVHSRRLRGM